MPGSPRNSASGSVVFHAESRQETHVDPIRRHPPVAAPAAAPTISPSTSHQTDQPTDDRTAIALVPHDILRLTNKLSVISFLSRRRSASESRLYPDFNDFDAWSFLNPWCSYD
jgi:hypothetical protein